MEQRAYEYLVNDQGEGGLVCDLDRAPMVNEPTIIIGLGGTGMDAMLHAKSIIQRKMKAPQGMKKPGRIGFLCVDTDEMDFRNKRVGDVRVDEEERLNVYSENLAACMRNPSSIPQAWMRDWLCEGINADNIRIGAGGIRQCGRFMLINKAQTFIERIWNVAAEVWDAGDENGEPFPPHTAYNVYLLTGVGGGTGSGMFLDAAYMIRMIFENVLHRRLNLRGIFFLPDVNLCQLRGVAACGYIPVNGYAALRELDYWMNPSRGRNFTQQYTPGMRVDTSEAPFDLCFMISPRGSTPSDYDACMRTTGETLMNILTEQASADGWLSFNFNSLLNVSPTMRAALAQQFGRSGNYIHASMGMDEQKIPLDSMVNDLACRLLTRVDGLNGREPLMEEVEGLFTRTLELDFKRGLYRRFDSMIPRGPFIKAVHNLDDFRIAVADYSRASVLDNRVLDNDLTVWVNQCDAACRRERSGLLEQCKAMLRSEIEKRFVNPAFGPYYAHCMVRNGNAGRWDIIRRLEEERNAVASFLSQANDRQNMLGDLANKALNEARRYRRVPLVSTARYDEYLQAVFRLYDHIRYRAFAQVAYDFYTRMMDAAVDYSERILERFSSLLTHLTKVFRSNTDIIAKAEWDGTTHPWNMGSFAKVRAMVDEVMAGLRESGEEDALVNEFLEHMLRERGAWVGDEGGLGESFSRFLSGRFEGLMRQTMEESCRNMYGLTDDDQLRAHIETRVLPGLRNGARVQYISDDELCPMSALPQSAVICVPNMAANIIQAAKDYVRDNNLPCTVASSRRQGSMFWFQIVFGLPLFANIEMKKYRFVHDRCGERDRHIGRYLRMSDRENWLELLPPLAPQTAR